MNFELSDEQRMWRQAVHEFCAAEVKPHAAEMDARSEFNASAVEKMAPLGLLGLNVPEELGGAGVDPVSAAIAIEELGWACGGTALSVAAHNGLACSPIALFGSESQKRRWLPDLARGRGGLGALALTEPAGGSDLMGGVQTRAELQGGEWVINGSKAWITNASVASLIVVLCRTNPQGGPRSLSLLVVPTASKGLEVHPAEKKMGVRASPTHALTFDGIRVPEDHLIGTPGDGIYQALDLARPLSDCHQSGVAIKPFDRVFAAVSVRPKDLDRVSANPLRHLGGEQFGHRGLSGEGQALAFQPGRAEDQQAGGFDLSRRVSDHPLNGLMLGERGSEGLPLLGISHGFFKSCLR